MEYYLRAKIVSINIRSKSRESNYKKEIVGLRVSGLRGLRASGFEELVGLGLVGLGVSGSGGYLAVDRLLKPLLLELGLGRPTTKEEKA
jgi:hypothetical protein